MGLMKSINLIIAAVAISATMLILASCEKNGNDLRNGEMNIINLSATSEYPYTKTSLGELNVVNWSSGDAITTFWGDNTTSAQFTLSSGNGTTSATFTGTPTLTTETCYALYPHNATTTINADKTISFTLPSSQTYTAGTFANGANPMVAYKKAAGELSFKNLCAVLKLQLKVTSGTKTIKKIIINSSTIKLSGAATVAMTYEAGTPAITMATDATASNFVELNLGVGVELTTEAKSFYIVVPPVSAGSYSITIETSTGAMLKTPTSGNTNNSLVRAMITTMPSLDYADSPNYIYNGVDYGAGTTIEEVTWAPVNCGYHQIYYPYGKLYQWGRKYGQGFDSGDATYPSGDNIVVGPVTKEVGESVANEYKFFKNSSTPSDWLSTQENTLWNSAWTSEYGDYNHVKVIENDPCPTGWRIPTRDEFKSLSANRDPFNYYYYKWVEAGNAANSPNGFAGVWCGNTNATSATVADPKGCIFFPAAGFRTAEGKSVFRGSHGYFWSSTPKDNNSYGLYFYDSSAYMNSSTRAVGLSVRCVKE
jgi:uncharacterized protein (TIGR02145 family)